MMSHHRKFKRPLESAAPRSRWTLQYSQLKIAGLFPGKKRNRTNVVRGEKAHSGSRSTVTHSAGARVAAASTHAAALA
jgi:hypothetical protein